METHNNKDDHHQKQQQTHKHLHTQQETNIHTKTNQSRTISTSIERNDYEEYVQKHAFITKTCTRIRYREPEGATPYHTRKHVTGKETKRGAGTQQSTTNQHTENIYGPDSEDST